MQFLVFSDSHGHGDRMLSVIAQHPAIRDILFLGDGLADLLPLRRRFPEHRFRTVRGNMDLLAAGFDAPDEDLFELYGVRVFLCHGHLFGVKGGTGVAEAHALAAGARVLLYGHTHRAEERYLSEDGLLVVNPGSIGRPQSGDPSYAILDILPSGDVAVSHGEVASFFGKRE